MSTATEVSFPDGFLWGAATSSYQVEGAVREDGRSPSIWDTLCRVPGAIHDGDTGDTADDHYHRYRDDVALMSSIGLQAYRFSVAWPRILPAGRGQANQAGLDFYRRLTDELLGAGIEPFLTLYHWDLPQVLQDAGGWPARDTARRFADYAAVVFEALHDRVRYWTTLNEPWCSSLLGYADGVHAPGVRDPRQATQAIHHLLLGHGLAVQAMRATDASRQVGVVLNLQPIRAADADPTPTLLDGVRRMDGLRNRVWTEPLFLGRYPQDVVDDLQAFGGLPVQAGDLEVIEAPLDFLGVNYYADGFLVSAPGATIPHTPGLQDVGGSHAGPDATDMGWPITPDGLRDLLVTLKATYPDLPPSTSPRTAWPTTIRSSTAPSMTRGGSPTSIRTCEPRRRPSSRASTCVATSAGRCWTTSSGRTATPCASASSTSTSRRRSAPRATAPGGIATSSPATGWPPLRAEPGDPDSARIAHVDRGEEA